MQATRLNILLLEDNPADAELAQRAVTQEVPAHFWTCDNEKDFRKYLDQGPDLVIADFVVPGFSGTKALEIVRSKPGFLPFIFISGSIGDEQAAGLILRGAQELVSKEHLARLPRAIFQVLKEGQLKKQKQLAEEQIKINEERLHMIYENVLESILLVARKEEAEKLEILRSNKRFQELMDKICPLSDGPTFQYDLLDLLEKGMGLPTNQVSYWQRHLEIALKDRETVTFEETFLTPLLEKTIVKVSAVPLQEGNGAKLLLVLRDITEERKGEERILSAIIETEERERKRISNDLHDSVGQSLSVALLNLNTFMKKLDCFNGPEQERIKKGMAYLNASIQEVRSISHNLMPKAIQDFGLETAIESSIEAYQGSVDMQMDFHSNLHGRRLGFEQEVILFRIFQEALGNILKHSGASHVEVQVMLHENLVTLSVEDNGIGFDPEAVVPTAGLGLNNMKSRVKSLSGTIEISSRPDRGTSIMVEFPTKTYEKEGQCITSG